MDQPLWTPDKTRIDSAQMTAFQRFLEDQSGQSFADYAALHRYSIDHMEDFWSHFIDWAGIKADDWGDVAIADGDQMPGASFFPDAMLSFGEHLLFSERDNADQALIFWGEDQVKTHLTQGELVDSVARFQQALRRIGVEKGDRVAAFMPNMPETIIAMLAATGLGAIWSSCSPDFGAQGVLDRFGQIEPKVLIAVEGYYYGGKSHDCLAKVDEIAKKIPSLERVVIVPYVHPEPDASTVTKGEAWDAFTDGCPGGKPDFLRVEFNHPLFIMFSSGTTGVPKCIVHGTGGTLLKHLIEHRLHSDTRKGSRLFYFTTCGWMMWNWMVSGLAAGATLLLYDGSPFHPDGRILFDYADAEDMSFFGTSAKYIDALHKGGYTPWQTHKLRALETIASTGSPLAPESFDYVYQEIKTDVHLASIAGGTDIIGCFVLGNPCLPVWRGEIQCAGLGMAVDVFADDGTPIKGEKGELVCTKPFPSMPVGFWNDSDGARYKSAYFERFDNIWHHGDYVAWTAHHGMIIFGRSDATLNPGGVRIGTAEIYREVEKLDQVMESIVVGQQWQGDVRVVLFVRLRDGVELDDDLIKAIKTQIRVNCTPRHVPAKVIAVADIPRTKSGKITEIAIRDIIHGRTVKNVQALANPQALDLYTDLEDLQA